MWLQGNPQLATVLATPALSDPDGRAADGSPTLGPAPRQPGSEAKGQTRDRKRSDHTRETSARNMPSSRGDGLTCGSIRFITRDEPLPAAVLCPKYCPGMGARCKCVDAYAVGARAPKPSTDGGGEHGLRARSSRAASCVWPSF